MDVGGGCGVGCWRWMLVVDVMLLTIHLLEKTILLTRVKSNFWSHPQTRKFGLTKILARKPNFLEYRPQRKSGGGPPDFFFFFGCLPKEIAYVMCGVGW